MDFIFLLFDKYGLLIVFLLVVLEYACFPFPSEILLPFMGYMVNKGAYSLIWSIVISVILGCLGSLLCYLLGYYGGSKIYNKIYNKVPSWRKGLDGTHRFFYKYGNLSVMVGRIIPMFRTYVSFFAGVFRQSLFKYFLYSIIGITIWNSLLISLGYYLSSNWIVVEKYYRNYKYIFILTVIFIVIIFVYKMYKKMKNTKNINGD